jgi:hypothetical protein
MLQWRRSWRTTGPSTDWFPIHFADEVFRADMSGVELSPHRIPAQAIIVASIALLNSFGHRSSFSSAALPTLWTRRRAHTACSRHSR